MIIGIPKEKLSKETRIAITPISAKKLINLGFTIFVEKNAGKDAFFKDQDFIDIGAQIVNDNKIWNSNIIIKINPPTIEEIKLIKNNSVLISFIWPSKNPFLLKELAIKNITAISMDSVPRISRAQSIDALSSMSNLTGYRSIIESAYLFGRSLNGQITAAGKTSSAKIIVIGAGVAGLSAIATARSLGAIVKAFDTRKEVKEQINSMGAMFLQFKQKYNDVNNNKTFDSNKINSEIKLLSTYIKETDIIISTALIPGKKAPILINNEMIKNMKPGSIIFDLAAENGGNCILTQKNKIVTTENNVKIIGFINLPSKMPIQASQLYSNNVINLIKLLLSKDNKKLNIDFKDEIIRNMIVTYDKKIIWPAPLIEEKKFEQTLENSQKLKIIKKNIQNKKEKFFLKYIKQYCFMITSLFFMYIIRFIPKETIPHFIIFLLSCIVGYYVVWNVSHKLHTPLMSVTNAISGIIIIGAIFQINNNNIIIMILSFLGILVSSINIFGGLTITQRMLKMFHKN
ncbi:Re/Si-specific NAD(P)(+) transhydrogenase subunit alpha [Enterobacteriaceae endosymbiont of Plateumaris consimilis]|uniref:Re/Si-specific NAD(P)(+) transhydrogenase subunit alpha n=1 Tax=Enterobacteriaceae endosymbiont of Plateumaris consimilis TaxID=2675794 RepID=UPI0014491E42|nr:Re/Si-specific NAD(P)(+) transhydrogenase subunit alpha [Enterobacteriaceae endosymbiont of Plateumaris consimilis]QJC28494.1 Re/Si-specific NAD(P)(+) transhydrogenase subunit alpha [Enterobacteriaceae endosymbiont of Plateumaris consimilis]